MTNKLAILVSGPKRFVVDVVRSMDKKKISMEYAFFIHIWQEDIGHIKRKIENTNEEVEFLKSHSNVAFFECEKPLNKDELIEKYGSWSGCPSPIYSIAGMFYAIDKLLKIAESYNFTHVLRTRTDICFFEKQILPQSFDSDSVYVANNPVLDRSIVSDHLMFCSITNFNKVWAYDSIDSFFEQYDEVGRDPEALITKKIIDSGLKTRNHWLRYCDYHVVYYPPNKHEPGLLNDIVANNPNDIFTVSFNRYQLLKLYLSSFIRGRSLLAGLMRRLLGK